MANRTDDIKNLKLYTLTELEDIIGVTHRTLQQYVLDGKLHAKKIGGKWRVTEEDLKAFLGNTAYKKVFNLLIKEIYSTDVIKDDEIALSMESLKNAGIRSQKELKEALEELMKIIIKPTDNVSFSLLNGFLIQDDRVFIFLNKSAVNMSANMKEEDLKALISREDN